MPKLNYKNLDSFLKSVSKLIDPKIKEVLRLFLDKRSQELIDYQIEVGGKRLRPALAVLSCLLCGGKLNEVLPAAAGAEILHNYTLIVDDIIDHSSLRRSKATLWFKFGQSIAQCVAMAYAAAIFQTANRSKKTTELSELFAKAVKKIFEGQVMDILFEQSDREEEKYIIKNRYFKITTSDYFEMIDKKAAIFMQVCCQAGGLMAGAAAKEMAALKNYGLNLGRAFQIRDDILDIFGRGEQFGKKIGKDIQERKLGNIVVLYALKELSLMKKKKVFSAFRKKELKDRDIKNVIKLIQETKAKEKACLLGKKYVQKAKESLKFPPQNKWNRLLADTADFVIERNK